jgi:multidrug efflux pump subunit AcrB
MTAVTTILGVLPVALGYSAGGEVRAGMGRATFGGMFASTFLTLFIVPVAYTLLDDLQMKTKNLFKRKRDRSSLRGEKEKM